MSNKKIFSNDKMRGTVKMFLMFLAATWFLNGSTGVDGFLVVHPPMISTRSSMFATSPKAPFRGQDAGLGLNKPPMELCDENANIVIDEIRNELGTIFGYTADSRAVGITGAIELVEVDGPTIVVSLSGRFWHATDTVMLRVESYIKNRIPEVIEVILDIEKSTIQDDNRLNTDGGKKLF